MTSNHWICKFAMYCQAVQTFIWLQTISNLSERILQVAHQLNITGNTPHLSVLYINKFLRHYAFDPKWQDLLGIVCLRIACEFQQHSKLHLMFKMKGQQIFPFQPNSTRLI